MKVIDLQEYKKEKDLKKAASETHSPLQIDSFYKNKELPLWIHVISHSIPSLFGGEQLVMAQAHDGKVLVFNFGEEDLWEPVAFDVFDKIVRQTHNDGPEAS